MSVIDTTLLVGSCPFRNVPGGMDDLNRLRERAELDLAIATGFRSLFYFDPVDGLERDLDEFAEASEWLRFLAVLDPEFPGLEKQIERAGRDARICGCRLIPGLHQNSLLSDRISIVSSAAGEAGLPVVISGRIFDDRVAPRAVDQAPVDMGELAQFLEAEKSTKFVLSMFFFGELKSMGVDWAGLPNVYLDLGCSKPSSASFDELPTWFPVNRVVFGTGAPYYYWGGSRLALEGSTLTEDAKADILGNNALEVFAWG